MRQIVGACKVFLKLSLRIRFKRAKENLASWGRVIGMIGRTVVRHADYAKNAMKIKAAQTIQAYFRARVADKEMKPLIEEKKFAATTVFRMWRTYEERTKLLAWLTQNCAAAKKRAEELANMSPEERKAREEKRKADRAAAAKAAAEAAAADAASRDAAANEADAAAAAAREAAMASQNANAVSMEDADKIKRQADAERAEKLRLAKEKAQRDKENSELWKLLHPVDDDDEYMDEEYVDDEGNTQVRHVMDFKKEGAHGHMFTVFHPRKNRTPHERFVKISFSDGEAKDISWGSGDSRTLQFSEIKFVIKGIRTKTMLVWKEMADDEHTFSVVCADKTLDCSASDDHSRDIWADGITKLLGQSEEDRKTAQDNYDPNSDVADVEKPREKTASQLETQRNLFAMIVKTTFREINYEGVYGTIGEPVRSEFQDDKFYQKALMTKTPWREWDPWV